MWSSFWRLPPSPCDLVMPSPFSFACPLIVLAWALDYLGELPSPCTGPWEAFVNTVVFPLGFWWVSYNWCVLQPERESGFPRLTGLPVGGTLIGSPLSPWCGRVARTGCPQKKGGHFCPRRGGPGAQQGEMRREGLFPWPHFLQDLFLRFFSSLGTADPGRTWSRWRVPGLRAEDGV